MEAAKNTYDSAPIGSAVLRPFSAHSTSTHSYNPQIAALHQRKNSQGQPVATGQVEEAIEQAGPGSTTAKPARGSHHATADSSQERAEDAQGQFEPSALALLVGGYHSTAQRPLDPTVSTLVEAAHFKHSTRKLQHPATYTYSMFEWRVQEATESARLASSAASLRSHPTSKRGSATNMALTSPRTSSNDGLYSLLGPSVSVQPPIVPAPPYTEDASAAGAAGQPSGAAPSGSGPLLLPQPAHATPYGGMHRRGSSAGAKPNMLSSASSVVSLDVGYRGPPSSSLEVVCEYDAHFQMADILGRHGQLVRPQPHSQIGPVAWLFRWYSKRGTQFAAGGPKAEDLVDAPPLPPAEPGVEVPASTSATSGRRLNRAPDPVINCEEVIDLLEDFEIVPKWVTRTDVARIFAAAAAVRSDPPNKLAKASMQPQDVRYPQFCDLLIRVAIAAAVARSSTPPGGSGRLRNSIDVGVGRTGGDVPSGRMSASFSGPVSSLAGGAGGSKGLDMRLSVSGPLRPTVSSSCGTVTGGGSMAPPSGGVLPPGRVAEIAAAAEAARSGAPHVALKALMDAMELTHPTVLALKHKLDALARMAKERGAAKKAIKWMYVASSEQSAVAAALRAPLMPGLDGWGVLSESRAPQFLHALLLAHDAQTGSAYTPCWRAFKEPALNLGAVQPGEVRCCRVVLRNRGRGKMHVRLDASGAPWAAATFNETFLARGIPRVVDVTLRFPEMGEFSGELRVHTLAAGEAAQHLNIVPIYALVGLPDAERKVPSVRSERASFAHKAAAAGVHLPPRGPVAGARPPGTGSTVLGGSTAGGHTATHSVYSASGTGALFLPSQPQGPLGGSGGLARQGSGRAAGRSSRGVSEDGGTVGPAPDAASGSLSGRGGLNATVFFAPGILGGSGLVAGGVLGPSSARGMGVAGGGMSLSASAPLPRFANVSAVANA